ncbi:MAG: SoxR reducing system RseC family protein [Gammaproteobacteria bacterium]|nr:SoxR reducing system RseC family protein [Gammaproteobacteria bacterium]
MSERLLEENGTVSRVEDGYAWVETERRTSCDSCVARSGCGTAVLAKVLGRQKSTVRAINRIGARAGDKVVLGLAEQALLQGSAAVYLVPLVSMMVMAGLGEWLASGVPGSVESVSILLGLLGLSSGLIWLSWFSRRIDSDDRYQPVLIRKLSSP